MRYGLFLVAFLSGVAAPAWSQNEEARSILDRYESIRPTREDLAFYRLDLAPSLDEARKRAARERRPILLVIIHARYGDLSSGHC